MLNLMDFFRITHQKRSTTTIPSKTRELEYEDPAKTTIREGISLMSPDNPVMSRLCRGTHTKRLIIIIINLTGVLTTS